MMRICTYIATIIFILLFSNSFGQTSSREEKLKNLFSQLPIDSNLSVLINAANSDTSIKKYENSIIESGYFTGYLTNNDQFQLQPDKYQIEIFTSDFKVFDSGQYGVGKTIADSILVVALYAYYGDTLTKLIQKQYIDLVDQFKSNSANSEKYTIHSEAGKIGEGVKFYEKEDEKFPYLTISLNYGDCVNKSYSIRLNYQRIDKWD